SKTSVIDPAKKIVRILNKEGLRDISYGIIISIKGRRDHRVTVKCNRESGAHLISVTGKRYKQELRMYEKISQEQLLGILKEKLGENFRIL
ncbi:hypothetical protein, partial [Oceanithermus sp.]